ncbi:MAG: ABC transporter ATP-binding protein [Deltaproteobacteria bacterium]|nr:ABC transporter ATP-binding protein [Deltaproteobacteria bacterium]
MTTEGSALVRVDGLRVVFDLHDRQVCAADDVSFKIGPGEALGIVGESGSGKSVVCASLLRLVPPPGRYAAGRVLFDGVDLLTCPLSQLRAVRGKRIAMVFQDPMTALNPYLRVGDQLAEALRTHEKVSRSAAWDAAVNTLRDVGIADPLARMRCHPHELSGGMRQRAVLAMALLTRPQLLIADEPTTALDVTVQAQVLELIQRARRELNMAVLLVSHDLGVVAGLCERVLVMYAGRVVESAPTTDLFKTPRHPYTRALLRSTPDLQAVEPQLVSIRGQPPDLASPIAGCAFAPRCDVAAEKCSQSQMLTALDALHATACVRVQTEGLQP